MPDYNFLVLTGRATKDPSLRYKASNQLKVEFSLEVERPFRRASGELVSDLFLIDAWGKVAQACAEGIRQGTAVLVIGTLNKESFATRHGRKEHMTVVKAKYVRVLRHGSRALLDLDWDNVKRDDWDEDTVADYLEAIEDSF